MRKIKFRVWDRVEDKMHKAVQINFPEELVTIWEDDNDPVSTITDDFDQFILMQFTGKLDHSGKEVYEGDILDFMPEQWGGEHIGVVEWNDYNAQWDFGGGVAEDVGCFRNVIGNIYENPELLKDDLGRK
jgi:uncharacterized phage protein (TIGR01671 family)